MVIAWRLALVFGKISIPFFCFFLLQKVPFGCKQIMTPNEHSPFFPVSFCFLIAEDNMIALKSYTSGYPDYLEGYS